MTDSGGYEYNVYLIDSDGNNIRNIYSKRCNTGLSFCTINIVDKYLIISFPITELESEIINMD